MARTPYWSDDLVNFDIQSGQQAQSDLTGSMSSTDRRGTTVIRTIVRLDLIAAIPNVGNGEQAVCLGIGMASKESYSASILPDPNTEADRPLRGWSWRDVYLV